MIHSDVLTDQQKRDCAEIGLDWDAQCATQIADIQSQAVAIRKNKILARSGTLPVDAQSALSQTILDTVNGMTEGQQ